MATILTVVSATLRSIHRYPVKSCRGESLAEAAVEPWGLAGDRRWMFVDPDGDALTAREVNGLLLVRPEETAYGVRLHAPGAEPLDVALPAGAERVTAHLWGSVLDVAVAGRDADDWSARVLGRPARLVHLDDPAQRPTDPRFSGEDDRVSLADGYPLLVTTEASLAALDDAVLERSQETHQPAGEPLGMTRFRPNLVVAGTSAWAEDQWRRVRVGDVVLRAVKGCARCVMTTVDPDTAERGREPIASLARIRRWDGATWFGVNLVPDLTGLPAGTPPPVVRVGDPVVVLEAAAPGGGPVRPA